MRLASLNFVGDAHAQEADINVSNPAIRALKDSIKRRSNAIKPYMDRGNIGIGQDGLLRVRTTDGLNLKERAEVQQLVEAENRDREALYAEIARYNKPGTLPLEFATQVRNGCPHDCGLCPDHQQHACLALIEVNSACNLDCPLCFANSGTVTGPHPPANGFELTFLVPESGSGMQSPVEMATVIQANLAAVGVKAKIQTLEWGAYLKRYLDGPDMAEMSWNPSIGDPDHMMYMLLSSDRFPPAFNAGFYQNDRVDDLLRRGRTTLDEAQRIPLYREAQRLVAEDAPWIFVDHGKQVIVHRQRVQGFKLHPNFDIVLAQVSLE